MEIWISEVDQERAGKILHDLGDRSDPDEFTPEELEALALPESGEADDGDLNDPPPDLSQEWYDDDPVAEVWNGDSEEFAEVLIACLREIGIASRKRDEQGHWSVVVRPEKESRAKEIVREVVEGRPQG